MKKRDIVIVNEFTIKNNSGGSRGKTPGDYVLRYMAREDATEQCVPALLRDGDNFLTKQKQRSDISVTTENVEEMLQHFKEMEGIGGVAFGCGQHSLSHEKVLKMSKEIQKNFDKGKTVFKTVLSFDQEYLRENGIVIPDFQMKKKGDYKGNVDQMKLRYAIMKGLDNTDFDDLYYVGVIQVDTKHVHCHLAMVDRGVGKLAVDGTQKGKILERNKRKIRNGIDMYLHEKRHVNWYSDVKLKKEHIKSYVMQKVFRKVVDRQMPQVLFSVLPENKKLWKYDSKSKSMKRANNIIREYVKSILTDKNSGYCQALESIKRYVEEQKRIRGLSKEKVKNLYHQERKKLMNQCIDGVFDALKNVPSNDFMKKTKLMENFSGSIDDIRQKKDDTSFFSYKIRRNVSKLQHHKKQAVKFSTLAQEYENSTDKSVDSTRLYDFFRFEQEYNEKLVYKYHFLFFGTQNEHPKKEYNIDAVKALDLQHLDFQAKKISKENIEKFTIVAKERIQKYKAAKNYLESTGQYEAIKILPNKDVELMENVMKQLAQKQLVSNDVFLERNVDEKVNEKTLKIKKRHIRAIKGEVASKIAAFEKIEKDRCEYELR